MSEEVIRAKLARTSNAAKRLHAKLERNGWQRMDVAGLFVALVMMSPDGKSVLVAKADRAWDRFIRIVYARPHKNLPRVASVRTFRKNRPEQMTVAIMERLFPLDQSATFESDQYMFKSVRKARNLIESASIFSSVNLRPSTAKVVNILSHAMGRTPNDLHYGNVMVRRGPNGGTSLILTDPYAFGDEYGD